MDTILNERKLKMHLSNCLDRSDYETYCYLILELKDLQQLNSLDQQALLANIVLYNLNDQVIIASVPKNIGILPGWHDLL